MGVPNKLLTLVFARQPGKLLLGMKKRGFGEGRWNGFGGKVEKGETIEQGARREMLEESCVTVNTIEEVGRIDFEFVGEEQILEVHVFQTDDFKGQPQETEEMQPKWFDIDDIPYSKMWPDDIFWFPYLLGNKKFTAYFKFEGMDKILEQTIEEVKTL
ncbi:oxidized purine nucleoside triphosphate hydrolase-like [Amphiura filiformis]|uniref:oxidized purine nucleoside triphosphate hydrolase-like n=1 Tax=Amphiura filiformis TaxID=82378 RepID=UPI003B218C1A